MNATIDNPAIAPWRGKEPEAVVLGELDITVDLTVRTAARTERRLVRFHGKGIPRLKLPTWAVFRLRLRRAGCGGRM